MLYGEIFNIIFFLYYEIVLWSNLNVIKHADEPLLQNSHINRTGNGGIMGGKGLNVTLKVKDLFFKWNSLKTLCTFYT